MKNAAGRGGCYPPRSNAEVDNILRDRQNSSYLGPFHFLSAPPLLKGYYGTPLGNNFQDMHPLGYLEWQFYPLGNPLFLKTL